MRMFIFSVTALTSILVLEGCASPYTLSPENLASQLSGGQKVEASELASTVSGQATNRNKAGAIERLLCTNSSGESIWVYPNENTELHITKRTGELITLYFDTVLLEGTKLKGVTSRIQKTVKEVDLSEILKIQVYTVNSKTEPAQSSH